MKEVTNDNVLPVPSIRNLPEDNDPVWIMGLNKDGDKVRSVPEVTVKHSLTLTGAVTGSGSLGSPVNTTLSTPIDANNKKITNVESPVGDKDAANKEYVDSNSSSASDYLYAPIWDATPWANVGADIQWEMTEEKGVLSLSGNLISQNLLVPGNTAAGFLLESGHSYELFAWVQMLYSVKPQLFNFEFEYQWYLATANSNEWSPIGAKSHVESPDPVSMLPATALVKVPPGVFAHDVKVVITKVHEQDILKVNSCGYCTIRSLD